MHYGPDEMTGQRVGHGYAGLESPQFGTTGLKNSIQSTARPLRVPE